MKILNKSEADKVELVRHNEWIPLLRGLKADQSVLLSAGDLEKSPNASMSLYVAAKRLGLSLRTRKTKDGGLLVSLVTSPKR